MGCKEAMEETIHLYNYIQCPMVTGFTEIMGFLSDEQGRDTAGTNTAVCIAHSTRGATKSKAQLQAVGLLIVGI